MGDHTQEKQHEWKPGNLYREIEIRSHFIVLYLINQAIKNKETMNSSNYTLVTYLSDIESKHIPCRCFAVLANLSF